MIQFCTILITLFSFISQPTLVEGLWVTQDDETKKDDNVVDADFEEVKEEETKEAKKEEDKEKSA